MDIKFEITHVCSDGNHVDITATANGKNFPMRFHRKQFVQIPDISEVEQYALILLRSFVKKSGLANDLPALKTAIEAEVFKI
jgi:hypothetical protein